MKTRIINHHFTWVRFIFMMAAFVLLSAGGYAQDSQTQRTIEVTGSAEMAVQPDQIKISVTLRSASDKSKEKDFLKILKDNKVGEDKVTFESSHNNHWWWYYSRYHDTSVQRYTVTLDSTINAANLMRDLQLPWVEQIRVIDKSNSKLQEYRKKVKIEAIKAAKEKATYLLAALGEELGSVVTVVEIGNNSSVSTPYYYWNRNLNTSSVSNSVVSSNQSGQSTVDGVSMQKLRYEVKVIFNIKEREEE